MGITILLFSTPSGSVADNVAIGEIYSALERGVIDGAIVDWHAIESRKFYEQLNYYVDAHVQVSPYFFLMNRQAYDSLDPELQQVIDDCSGAAALAICGSYWDDAQKACMEAISARGGEIYTFEGEEQTALQAVGQSVMDEWIAEKTAMGYDAQGCFDTARELIQKHYGK